MRSYTDARDIVLREVARGLVRPEAEIVSLPGSLGRVLADDVRADRDYPPFDRSTRDGYAVRSADLISVPARLRVIGEVSAGSEFKGGVAEGECVRIMTGAPLPEGCDAVVMVEFTEAGDGEVEIRKAVPAGANVVLRGTESRKGNVELHSGTRIGYAAIAALGQVGCARVPVFRKPRVAVLSTGDEVVSIEQTPGPVQIRNSNSQVLAAQVALAGGEAVSLGNAPDDPAMLEAAFRRGLEEDLLVITGGVSMGKYDFVEDVLAGLGAKVWFDSVAIRPGRPAVFATVQGRPVLGLPGNPLSTMLTFELFGVPAVELLSGGEAPALRYHTARLMVSVEPNPELTLFLPASRTWQAEDLWVRPIPWKGSGDVSGGGRTDSYVVVPPGESVLQEGSRVTVLTALGTGN